MNTAILGQRIRLNAASGLEIFDEIKQKIASSLTLLAMTVRDICGSLRAKRSNLNARTSHGELPCPGKAS